MIIFIIKSIKFIVATTLLLISFASVISKKGGGLSVPISILIGIYIGEFILETTLPPVMQLVKPTIVLTILITIIRDYYKHV